MLKITLPLLGLCFLLLACNSNSDQSGEQLQENGVETGLATKDNLSQSQNSKSFKIIEDLEISNRKVLGKIINQKSWTDKNGNNIILLTQPENTFRSSGEGPEFSSGSLYAYHYVQKGNDYMLIRKIQDFQNDCGFFLEIEFVDQILEITDIDKDGYAEVSFVYIKNCSSEISPDEMKLMMLENGDKYAIRGRTKIRYHEGEDGLAGGEKNIDPGFSEAPDGFEEFASNLWDKAQEQIDKNRFKDDDPIAGTIKSGAVGTVKIGKRIEDIALPGDAEFMKQTETVSEEGEVYEITYYQLVDEVVQLKAYVDDNNSIISIVLISDDYVTEKGIACFDKVSDFIKAYPDYNMFYTYISDEVVLETPKLKNIRFVVPEYSLKNKAKKDVALGDMVKLSPSDLSENAQIDKIMLH